MLIAAAAETATGVSRLGRVPVEFWVKLGLAIVLIVAVVYVLRKLAHMNKGVLCAVVLLVISFVGFNWVYERNEPTWATPVVSFLADFLPSKGTLARR